MEDICRGCESYTGDYCESGINPKISESEQCPCSTCLVKILCNDNPCDDFENYARKYDESQRNVLNYG